MVKDANCVRILDRLRIRPYTLLSMNRKSGLLYAGSGWQVARFIAITALVYIHLDPTPRLATSVILVWPGVSQLAIAAGLFFLARDREHYGRFRSLLIFAKILEALPGLALLVVQALALYFGVSTPLRALSGLSVMPGDAAGIPAVAFYYAIAVTVLLDLILLLLLLSLKLEASFEQKEVQSELTDVTSNLPELEETTLEDE